MEISLIFVYVSIYCVAMGITTLMSISERSDPYFFPSKDGENVIREGRNGLKDVDFPPESASFLLMNNMIKVLFHICILTWRVNNYVSRQGRV